MMRLENIIEQFKCGQKCQSSRARFENLDGRESGLIVGTKDWDRSAGEEEPGEEVEHGGGEEEQPGKDES